MTSSVTISPRLTDTLAVALLSSAVEVSEIPTSVVDHGCADAGAQILEVGAQLNLVVGRPPRAAFAGRDRHHPVVGVRQIAAGFLDCTRGALIMRTLAMICRLLATRCCSSCSSTCFS